MPGNNSIQILRGSNVKSSSASSEVLLAGQPLYDLSTGYLYVGDGEANIRTIQAINARYANSAGSAGSATSATTASKLSRNIYFNGNGTNVSWNGSANEVVYAPTALGSAGKVWGIASNGRAAWIAQTEIPDTIDHANTADVAYSVSGINVTGTVANANYANFAGNLTAGNKTINGNLTVMSNINVVGGSSLDYLHINGSSIQGGPQPISITSENDQSFISVSDSEISISSMCSTGGLALYSNGKANARFVNGIDIYSGGGIDINSNSASIVANGINISTKSTSQSVRISSNYVNITSNGTVRLNSLGSTQLEADTLLKLQAPTITFSSMPYVNGVAINDSAGRVGSNLYFNGAYWNGVAYNQSWNGSTTDVIYVPTNIGNPKQMWGMVNGSQAGWIDSPGFEYQGFIDSNGYSLSGKRVLAICVYGSASAYIRRNATNVVTGIRGPVVSIDATRGADSSVVYITDSGTPSHATFNSSSSVFQAPGGTRWSIFTYSSI